MHKVISSGWATYVFCIGCAAFFSAHAHADPQTSLPSYAANAKRIVSIEGREGSVVRLAVPRQAKGSVYRWDLDGDKTFETRGRVVEVVFPDNGKYRVRYRISPPAAKSNRQLRAATLASPPRAVTGRKVVEISNVPPTADIGGPYEGSSGQSLRFLGLGDDSSLADRRAGIIYTWDFGDGSEVESGADLTAPLHTYAAPGIYTATLVTRDKDSASSSESQTTVSIVAPNPTPNPTNPPNNPTSTPTPVPPAATTKVNPQEIQGVIPNPEMGWQSGDKVNTSGSDAQGIANKVAYIKYYWKDLETGNGVFNWTTFEQRLTQARNSGQKVAFRIVAVDPITSAPTWLRDAGAAGTWIRYYADGGNTPQVWSPTLSDPIFQQKHAQFMQVLGQRYNGHPDIAFVDIGSVGWWGEWHFWSSTPTIPTPSAATMRTIIDQYVNNFPNTPLVAQLENATGLSYAISRGTGYRGDCIGAVDNQMPYLYEPNIQTAQAQDAWRHAPIHFETCWDIRHWVEQGWNLRYIMDWMLAHHVSGLNNKNAPVPSSAMSEVTRLLTRMGYRYVLRELRHPQKAHAGNVVTLSMDWENIGVAPSYGRYVFAMQLRRLSGTVVATQSTQNRVKNWMPGPLTVDEGLVIPSNLAPGTYSIAIGIVDPTTGQPQVRLAIAGRESSGWYPVSTIKIE